MSGMLTYWLTKTPEMLALDRYFNVAKHGEGVSTRKEVEE